MLYIVSCYINVLETIFKTLLTLKPLGNVLRTVSRENMLEIDKCQ